MSEKKWLSCPFCGTRLTNEKPSKIYVHERTGCLLDLRGFTEVDYDKWNTRKPMEEVVDIIESFYDDAEHYGFASAISDMVAAIKETAIE